PTRSGRSVGSGRSPSGRSGSALPVATSPPSAAVGSPSSLLHAARANAAAATVVARVLRTALMTAGYRAASALGGGRRTAVRLGERHPVHPVAVPRPGPAELVEDVVQEVAGEPPHPPTGDEEPGAGVGEQPHPGP